MKLEFIIAVADKMPVMDISDVRKREGDVVGVVPPDKDIGFKVLDEYMYVPVYLPIVVADTTVRNRLVAPYYEGGKVFGVDFATSEENIDPPPKISKFRHKIPLNILGDVNLVKTRDTKCIYQPFLRESRIIGMKYWNKEFLALRYKGGVYEARRTHRRERVKKLEVINGAEVLSLELRAKPIIVELSEEESPWRQIYCSTATVEPDVEKVFEWSMTRNLIVDKHTNDWLGVQVIG